MTTSETTGTIVTCMVRTTVPSFQQVPPTRSAATIDQHDSHSNNDSTNGFYYSTCTDTTCRPCSYQNTTTNRTKLGYGIEHLTDPAGYTSKRHDPWGQLTDTEATDYTQSSTSSLLRATSYSVDHRSQVQATTTYGHSPVAINYDPVDNSAETQAATTRATTSSCST